MMKWRHLNTFFVVQKHFPVVPGAPPVGVKEMSRALVIIKQATLEIY